MSSCRRHMPHSFHPWLRLLPASSVARARAVRAVHSTASRALADVSSRIQGPRRRATAVTRGPQSSADPQLTGVYGGLSDQDRIFQNLYGKEDWRLQDAERRVRAARGDIAPPQRMRS